VLLIREVHHVIGAKSRDFERAYRERWAGAVARDDGSRLLWYANHAHLTCFAYHVLTMSAVRDGAAWGHLADRVHAGDLLEVTRELDGLRHDVEASLLLPPDGSSLADLDLRTVPSEADHDPTLIIEDRFVSASGSESLVDVEHDGLGDEVASFLVAHPEHGDEALRWTRVLDPQSLLASLLGTREPAPRTPGVEHRESSLWRVSTWSPLH
jgi:hypothetical protein